MKLDKPVDILVQRRGAIGDVIMSTGVIRELKKKYGPTAAIDVATDYGEAYRNNPHIRNVFPVDQVPAVNNRYEVYINLDDAYEQNPENHYIDSYFHRAFGTTEFDRSVELFPTDDDRDLVDRDIVEIDSPYVVVHLRNWHWQAKNISMDVWLDVFLKVFEVNSDVKFVCVGGPTDHFVEHPLFVDARDRYNMQQLMHLCKSARCFVGIDSGPYWCAAASGTTMIPLLTHLLPERIVPFVSRAHWVQTLEDCAGCNDTQARPVRQVLCKKSTYPCVDNFDTADIALKILGTL
jgi:ADP-heptose:LPS heptosyltransferase